MTSNTQKPGSDPNILLRLSEQFLRRRYFSDCRKYAHQAYQLDPELPGVSETLAVADVLLSSHHQTATGPVRDWYEVLQIDRFTQNSGLIKRRFDQLYGLLNPSYNKLPFADEAFGIVCDAWYVLSNRVEKVEFDEFLKKVLEGEEDERFEFWTVCPYCYYLYEYPRVYVDLCVRCVNDECGKAFTCVEIGHPPVEVLSVGRYVCDGFVMLGLKSGCWNPFAPVRKRKHNVDDNGNGNDNTKRKHNVDDNSNTKPKQNTDDNGNGNGNAKRKQNTDDDNGNGNGNGNGEFVMISDDEEDEVVESKRDGGVEGVKVETVEADLPTVKVNVGRKKSVAKKTKKVTGVGNRVPKEAFVNREEFDDCEYF